MDHDEFVTSVDLSRINIEVLSIDDSVDRTQYSSMRECLKCKTALGKTGAKKYFCYFCYRAICVACSPAEVLHPETRKLQKMCFPCYINNIKLQVLKVGAGYVVFRLKKEIQEREKLIKERQELEKIVVGLQTERQAKQAEMNSKIVEKQQQLKEQQEKYEKTLRDYEKVKVEYDQKTQQHGESLPEAHHRSGDCMKCEVF